MSMLKKDYRKFYDRVGKTNGWDFSASKYTSEGVLWDFYQEVIKKSGKNSVLLDIGAGGGEKVLDVFEKFQFVVAIDNSKSMIEVAKKNLVKSGAKNVKFLVMDGFKVKFPNEFFDIISCRHSDFSAKENYRLLRRGGIFMTQQVGKGDKKNIVDFFGYKNRNSEDETSLDKYTQKLKAAGFLKIKSYEYDAIEHYQSLKDLAYLLMHAPIINDFGKKGDLEKLEEFAKLNMTEKGIKTNSKRYMIIAQK